jgi:hypothetical protein
MAYAEYPTRQPLVQWRAVFAGTVIGLAVLALLAALWSALAYGSHTATILDSYRWFIAGSAIFSTFLAGYLAGMSSGVRGPSAGFFTGLTVWGLGTIAVLAVGIPSVMGTFNVHPTRFLTGTPGPTLWTLFWAVLIGLGAAVFGGMLGGMSRPAMYGGYATYEEPATVHTHTRRRTGTEG